MERRNRAVSAMLAATALAGAAASIAPSHANNADFAGFPAIVDAPAALGAAGHEPTHTQSPAKRWALVALAAGALAGLVKLVGVRRALRAGARAAEASGRVALAGARVAGRALRAPLRYAGWVLGLSLFALLGAGIYDVEWIAGLLAGAALAGFLVFFALKLRARVTSKA